MIRWIPYAFIRIVLFFIGGIVLGIYAKPISLTMTLALFATMLFFYPVSFFISRLYKISFLNPGYIALPAVFIAGYLHVHLQTESERQSHLSKVTIPIKFYRAVITGYAEEKARSWRTEARVQGVFTGKWHQAEGNVLLYFSKETFTLPFRYGDVLLIKGAPTEIAAPSNPGEFDYKRFLSFKNIYHQHFLRDSAVRLLKNDPPVAIVNYAIYARRWAENTLKKFIKGEREQAIAQALILGITDGLDNELLSAYAATGSMHVLAVSGLHVTIIYMMWLWLLTPLMKLRAGPVIAGVTAVVLLWSYAFITGLSPSVLRAVTMFSFIALARIAQKHTNIYNTLAASAFCLLLYDPFFIMSVGFQLSYLAVLGIVYLHPGIYQLWQPGSYLWDQAWKITSVSIAAQIATFSLGLLYFHQFPNYFLLSNLAVIPGSFFVLVLGILMLSISFIPVLAEITGFVLTLVIKALNLAVFAVESLPFSLSEDIYISAWQCWLIFAFIVFLILLMHHKRFTYCLAAFVVVLLFVFFQWQHFYEKIKIKKITVYNVANHSAIDLIDHGHAYFVSDSMLPDDQAKVRFHIHPNRLQAGVNKVAMGWKQPFIREFPGGKTIVWNGRILIHLLKSDFILPLHIQPGYVIIGNNAVHNLSALPRFSSKTTVIFDSSNSYFYIGKLLEQAKHQNLKVHSVMHHGAFDSVINTLD